MNKAYEQAKEIPVLTDVVGRGILSRCVRLPGLVSCELSVEPDGEGYDPYNNAPPLPPQNKATARS